MSETKQVCETTSIFEVDNIKFCEASFKNGKLSAELTASYQCVLRFFHSICLKYTRKSIRSAAPVTQNHLPKTEEFVLQNATPLKKSTPWSPNISDEHVSGTAPATRNATPAIVFETATKPSRFAHLWQGAQSVAPATQNDIWTSKSGPNMWWFQHFDLDMCFTPLPRALFRHLNFKKCSEPGVFRTFDLEMCFAPQRCALVHLSSPQMAPILHKKDEHLPSFGQVGGQEVVSVGGSEINADSFMFDSEPICSCWTPRRFETGRACSDGCWPWTIWQFFISSGHMAPHPPLWRDYILFDPPEPQIIGKTQCFATFLPFRAPGSSCFWNIWNFLFCDLLSSSLLFSDSSPLCFSISEVWLLNFLRLVFIY